MKIPMPTAFCLAAVLSFGAVTASWAADLGITQTGTTTLAPGSIASFTLHPVVAGTEAFGGSGALSKTAGQASGGIGGANSAATPAGSNPLATAIVTVPYANSVLNQVSASGTGWACTVNNVQVSCSFGHMIAAGQPFPPISITAHANAAGSYQNCASIAFTPVAGTSADTVPGNNSACITVTVTGGGQQGGGQQQGNCMAQNGVPVMVTGNGSGSTASMAAKSDWSSKAAFYGNAYSSWSHSQHQSESCSSALSGLQYVTTCHDTAQPCQ
jgi:hypothetical protein